MKNTPISHDVAIELNAALPRLLLTSFRRCLTTTIDGGEDAVLYICPLLATVCKHASGDFKQDVIHALKDSLDQYEGNEDVMAVLHQTISSLED